MNAQIKVSKMIMTINGMRYSICSDLSKKSKQNNGPVQSVEGASVSKCPTARGLNDRNSSLYSFAQEMKGLTCEARLTTEYSASRARGFSFLGGIYTGSFFDSQVTYLHQ